MAVQDIIVIGASAGGVEALRVLTRAMPRDLPAAVFAVLHIGQRVSILPEILTASGALPAIHPKDGQKVEHGTIYVAPSDHHLLIEDGHIHLSHGPKENRSRPAINPLFRSAALAYGPRVAGVILTGLLDDGVSGLWEIKRRGGVALVQDPEEAVYPSMPQEAIAHVSVDHVARLAEMPELFLKLSTTESVPVEGEMQDTNRTVSDITCPDCRGTLWQEQKGSIVDYRCRVGHAYSALGMADHHREAQEKALWAAAVALEEGAAIDERLAPQLGSWYKGQAKKKRQQAAILKNMITGMEVNENVREDDRSGRGDSPRSF
jgi:two-component system, chemotaxis family, protein-glutamate methylesterase/glutaminase